MLWRCVVSRPTLNGTLIQDGVPGDEDFSAQVLLCFGDQELASWDVTARSAEWAEQPGDYRSREEQWTKEERFVEEFLAEKLAAVFGDLEGAIKP
jgi:hypothetical protein